MERLKLKIFATYSTLLMICSPCHGDRNEYRGTQCSATNVAPTAVDNEYEVNLNNTLNSLAADAPIQNVFYMTTFGKGDNKVYSLVQCRGDISATDCVDCIKNATMVRGCDGKDAVFWFRWCLLRYSNASFFGEWDQSAAAFDNDTNFEDPNVVPKGLDFADALASSTPNQPLLFQTAVMDVGLSGKRYGLAQCTRDLSKSDCGRCLQYQLVTFRTIIGNKRGWEIYGSSCTMLYHDYQFYLNISTITNEGSARYSPHRVAVVMTIPALVFLSGI